ncbi:DUF2304 domain-containing protein [Candidatus Woesebacteria bacterium]|nr:DUF2304 domain-containing protein [Candidatus Woesebacteria bacterium]
MNFLFYQIIIFGVGFLFIAKAISHYLRKEQTIRELIAIFIFWISIFIFTTFPEILEVVAGFLGFKGYINGLFIGGFVVLFYSVFKLILKSDKQERQITELVRKLAIEDAKKKK